MFCNFIHSNVSSPNKRIHQKNRRKEERRSSKIFSVVITIHFPLTQGVNFQFLANTLNSKLTKTFSYLTFYFKLNLEIKNKIILRNFKHLIKIFYCKPWVYEVPRGYF